MENKNNSGKIIAFIIIGLIILYFILNSVISGGKNIVKDIMKSANLASSDRTFNIISSSENEDLEEIIQRYAKSKGYDVNVEYAGTLDIMQKLNAGEKYDAVWVSNSIWLYMADDNVKISDSKYTSINPVIFGIKKSKAEELGFTNKDVYTRDIVDAIATGKLKFSMSNPTSTNSGASAY